MVAEKFHIKIIFVFCLDLVDIIKTTVLKS